MGERDWVGKGPCFTVGRLHPLRGMGCYETHGGNLGCDYKSLLLTFPLSGFTSTDTYLFLAYEFLLAHPVFGVEPSLTTEVSSLSE